MTQFLKLQQLGGEQVCNAHGDFDEGVFAFGASICDRFLQTPAGRSVRMMSIASPHRIFSVCPSGYSLLVNFGDRSYEKTGPNTGVFTFKNDFLGPVHNAGVFASAFRLLYRRDLTIEVHQEPSPLDIRFNLSWL